VQEFKWRGFGGSVSAAAVGDENGSIILFLQVTEVRFNDRVTFLFGPGFGTNQGDLS
jgi:hypothetical protein